MVRSISSNNNHNMSNFIIKVLNFKLKLNTHRASDRRNSWGLLLPTTSSTKPIKKFQKRRPAATGDGDGAEGGGGGAIPANSGSFRRQTTAQIVPLVESFPTVPSMRQSDVEWKSYGRLKFWKFLKKRGERNREREREWEWERGSVTGEGRKEKRKRKKKEKEKEKEKEEEK